MASQVVPPSEEEEIERKKDKKDEEVLDALGNIVPKEDKRRTKRRNRGGRCCGIGYHLLSHGLLKPLSWIKSLLSLPFIIGLGGLFAGLTAFFLFNPIGIALLTIGIIAINWKDIKKAIKGYVNTVKGWIRTALSAIGLGAVADKMFGPEDW